MTICQQALRGAVRGVGSLLDNAHKWLGVSTVENRRKRTELDIVIAWRRTQGLLDLNPVA
jgi:hypothetical protein